MAPNSLQTSTGTRISLHKIATIVGHQTGPESTLRYARLRTLYVVNVARRGTSTHYAEAVGHPYTCWRHKTTVIHSLRSLHKTITRVQRLHSTPHHTSYPEKSEHIQPAWIAQSQSSKKHQVDIEIDTGAGCNVMPLYKVHEHFGQE